MMPLLLRVSEMPSRVMMFGWRRCARREHSVRKLSCGWVAG